MKKALLFFVGLSVCAVCMMYWSSQEKAHYDDHGLESLVVETPPAHNAYPIIAYTQDESFTLLEGYDSARLNALLYREGDENAQTIQTLLQSSAIHLDALTLAVERKHLSFPRLDSIYDVPAYQPIMNMIRLALLSSKRHAEKASIDLATEHAILALKASYMLKEAGGNANLLSYMIGLAMQYEALTWVHYFVGHHALEARHYQSLLAALDIHSNFNKEGFQQVFVGEFIFTKAIVNEMFDESLLTRLKDFFDGDGWGSYYTDNMLYAFFYTLIPNYYLDKNKMLTDLAKFHKENYDKSHRYCYEATGSNNVVELEVTFSWRDILTPNSLSKYLKQNVLAYQDYFQRRCLAYAHQQAVKAIVSLKYYFLVNQQYPESLDVLLPQYLNALPVDPLSAKAMTYSRAEAWLYSMGVNLTDNSGSQESYFFKRCLNNDACANNPTFPINFKIPNNNQF